MKAIVYTQYGPADVLHLQEVELPTPKDNEVLIKVHATSVNAGDCNARGFTFVPPGFGLLTRLMFGLRKPKRTILGGELSGEIAAVGKDVRQFKQGDLIFGNAVGKFGAYAEYVCLAEDALLVKKPANMTCEEAAAIPFGAIVCVVFPERCGETSAWAKNLDYWRFRVHWRLCSTACQVLWSRSQRGLQHNQSRAGEIPGR